MADVDRERTRTGSVRQNIASAAMLFAVSMTYRPDHRGDRHAQPHRGAVAPPPRCAMGRQRLPDGARGRLRPGRAGRRRRRPPLSLQGGSRRPRRLVRVVRRHDDHLHRRDLDHRAQDRPGSLGRLHGPAALALAMAHVENRATHEHIDGVGRCSSRSVWGWRSSGCSRPRRGAGRDHARGPASSRGWPSSWCSSVSSYGPRVRCYGRRSPAGGRSSSTTGCCSSRWSPSSPCCSSPASTGLRPRHGGLHPVGLEGDGPALRRTVVGRSSSPGRVLGSSSVEVSTLPPSGPSGTYATWGRWRGPPPTPGGEEPRGSGLVALAS